ncbi:MAG: hypothetical protein WKG00_28570 [Polyangiaceae bacterium]
MSGNEAHIRWRTSLEESVIGYRVYQLGGDVFEILLRTPAPVNTTTFRKLSTCLRHRVVEITEA